MKPKPLRVLRSPLPACAVARAGFTMVELLIVIVLVAILLALAMPSFNTIVQRYRVNMAATNIANALQFARMEAIRRSANVTVGQATAPVDCTNGGPENWHCGVDVYVTAGAPLKTIPASSLSSMNVQIFSNNAPGATLVYTPMSHINNAAVNSFIYVWHTALGPTPSATIPVINTVCATGVGKVRVVSSYVSDPTLCN